MLHTVCKSVVFPDPLSPKITVQGIGFPRSVESCKVCDGPKQRTFSRSTDSRYSGTPREAFFLGALDDLPRFLRRAPFFTATRRLADFFDRFLRAGALRFVRTLTFFLPAFFLLAFFFLPAFFLLAFLTFTGAFLRVVLRLVAAVFRLDAALRLRDFLVGMVRCITDEALSPRPHTMLLAGSSGRSGSLTVSLIVSSTIVVRVDITDPITPTFSRKSRPSSAASATRTFMR